MREYWQQINNAVKNHAIIISFFLFVLGFTLAYFMPNKKTFDNLIHNTTLLGEDAGESSRSDQSNEVNPAKTANDTLLTVDIQGAVVHPGVYRLESGSRVVDILEKAGGISNEVSVKWVSTNLNLAEHLEESEKIYVPFEWETNKDGEINISVYADATSTITKTEENTETEVSKGRSNTDANTTNINTATKSELMELPGIGKVYAQRLIDARPFKDVNDMTEKVKIPAGTLEKMRGIISF